MMIGTVGDRRRWQSGQVRTAKRQHHGEPLLHIGVDHIGRQSETEGQEIPGDNVMSESFRMAREAQQTVDDRRGRTAHEMHETLRAGFTQFVGPLSDRLECIGHQLMPGDGDVVAGTHTGVARADDECGLARTQHGDGESAPNS